MTQLGKLLLLLQGHSPLEDERSWLKLALALQVAPALLVVLLVVLLALLVVALLVVLLALLVVVPHQSSVASNIYQLPD